MIIYRGKDVKETYMTLSIAQILDICKEYSEIKELTDRDEWDNYAFIIEVLERFEKNKPKNDL